MKKNTFSENCCFTCAKFAFGIIMICFSGLPLILIAQDSYRAVPSQDDDIKVLGTSNLHNWTLETKNISCSAQFNFLPGSNHQPQSLTSLNFSIPVQNLKSGESLLDSRAYAALKAAKYSTIVFVLTAATILPAQKDHFQVKSTGNLSIAGVTKLIDMDVDCLVNPDGTITCSGSGKLKMTDYQIKPPAFMFGALRTGNELTIDLTMILNK